MFFATTPQETLTAWIGYEDRAMNVLQGTLIAVPVLTGIWLIGTRHRAPVVTLGSLSLATLCAALLLLHTNHASGIGVEWLPGTGAMALGQSTTSLYAVLTHVNGAQKP